MDRLYEARLSHLNKKSEAWAALWQEWRDARRSISDEIKISNSSSLLASARARGINAPAHSWDDSEYEDPTGYWQRSDIHGFWFLTEMGEADLRRRIRQDQKEQREAWAFWANLIIGLLGAIASVLSVLVAFWALRR